MGKRRVVISGLGIVSNLGHTYLDVVEGLKKGKSGIKRVSEWQELGLRATIAGLVGDVTEKKEHSGIAKKHFNCMSNSSLYCTLAAKDAIEDAGLEEKDLSHEMAGCLVGSGIGSATTSYEAGVRLYNQKANRINPYSLVRSMSNTCSANIATVFHIGGRSYSISSACSTSLHNIGHAFELIRNGALEIAVAGGGEEIDALVASAFCALRGALSVKYNDTPEKASRPYDVERDGFVLSEGGGIVIVESLERAQARGAEIYCEIIGFWANSDGYDMVLPEPQGVKAAECMRMAIKDAGISPASVDYINTHGTSTRAGDIAEMRSIRNVFGDNVPLISSTKSIGGHAIGAAGVNEIIHCIGMLQHDFVAPSINIECLDPAFEGLPIVTEPREKTLDTLISNSFGFGGTNGVIILKKYGD